MKRLLSPDRVTGVDIARGLALIGMMATHIVPSTTGGEVSLAYQLASGRASALFAVLAGVALALVTGGERPASGRDLAAARRSVAVRAGVIAFIGLSLGVLDSGVAVILVNYGLLFAVSTVVLGLGWRVLAPAGLAWLVVTPVLAHALRPLLTPGPGPSPSWFDLAQPVVLLERLLLTGYYPVLQWTGYLLVGLAVGRLPLRRTATAVWLAAAGAVTAGLAKVVSGLLLPLGYDELSVPMTSPIAGRPLDLALQTGMFGTTPTTSWWWLVVSGPHSGTSFDLLHTTGTALLALGACLLAAQVARRWLLPLAATGSMTLTLYSVHVVVLASTRDVSPSWDPVAEWAVHVVAAVVLASLWALTGARGPLEALTAEVSGSARRPLTGRGSARAPR
ncbi:MAG TPA: heparan-alpha-glucosaminide N-acetyltransferase domain-containing protein [Actinomycetales bacterium]|nr:heparan-alpha-glucosaminide N-acetyltransferase domain-containing protein [Actinomycetales bacterium]